MFRRLEPQHSKANQPVVFVCDGRTVEALPGDTVASALLAAGMIEFRMHPVAGTARGPYCMMGVCFECLLEIDGHPNVQACQVSVQDGMVVATQPTDAAGAGPGLNRSED
jgi:predicted molibdopterin-dependent oxidoreductase YjgC